MAYTTQALKVIGTAGAAVLAITLAAGCNDTEQAPGGGNEQQQEQDNGGGNQQEQDNGGGNQQEQDDGGY
ncbi:hypothetical protein [Halopolyspora algeriensis]|nr:hypothetical protein [Halopolyspora algeriensis]